MPPQRGILGAQSWFRRVGCEPPELSPDTFIENPRRVGKPLHGDLGGIHSGRRGTYRVLYRINDERHEVVVVGVDHHGVYGPS